MKGNKYNLPHFVCVCEGGILFMMHTAPLVILFVVRQWRENVTLPINVQLEAVTVNVSDIIFILVLCPRITGQS